MGTDEPIWPCEAYGPEAVELGVLCFFADQGERLCADHEECQRRLTDERVRVFDRMQELAATGDPVAVELAQTFTSPEQLLGGSEAPPED